MAQLVRAPPCHGGGRGFEPRPDRHFGSVAQSVEQRTENPRVAGSIPAGTTIRMMQVYPSPAEGIGLENRQRIKRPGGGSNPSTCAIECYSGEILSFLYFD